MVNVASAGIISPELSNGSSRVTHDHKHESVTGDLIHWYGLVLFGVVRGQRKIALSNNLSTLKFFDIPQNFLMVFAKLLSHD